MSNLILAKKRVQGLKTLKHSSLNFDYTTVVDAWFMKILCKMRYWSLKFPCTCILIYY